MATKQTPSHAATYLHVPQNTLARQITDGLVLGGWLGIMLLLFVGVGLFTYLPCASFAELGLFLFFFAAWAQNGWRWRRTPLDPLIGALLAVQVLGTAWGYAGGYGVRSPYAAGPDAGGVFGPLQILFDHLAAFAAYYLAAWRLGGMVHAEDDEGRSSGFFKDPLVSSLFLSAGVVLLLCLVEWGVSLLRTHDGTRIQATFGNPNLLGSYLAIMALIAGGAAIVKKAGNAARLSAALLSAGLLFALWLTQSRGAWIGVALGAAFLAAVQWAQMPTVHAECAARGRMALKLLLGISLLALLFGALVAPRIDSRWHGHSVEERHLIWQAAFSMIRSHPFIGVGVGGFPAAMADLHMKQLNDFTPSGYPLVPAIHLHAHNILLQAAAEKGVFGVLLCLWLIGAILAGCRALLIGAWPQRALSPLAAGLGAGLIALLTQCFADYTLWYAPVLILAWLALGALFAFRRD